MANVTFNKPTLKSEFQIAMKYPAGTLCVDEAGDAVVVMKLPLSAMVAYKRASTSTSFINGFTFEMQHRQRFLRLRDGTTAPCGVKCRRMRPEEQPVSLTNEE